MRAVAALIALLSLAAAGAAGYELYQQIETPPAGQSVSAAAPSVAALPQDAAPPALRAWPALFGTVPAAPVPVAPPPAPKPAPAPKVAQLPPLETLGLRLDGVVRSGERVWALVAQNGGTQLVSVGAEVAPGAEVVAIDAGGVWLSRRGNPPERLGFAE